MQLQPAILSSAFVNCLKEIDKKRRAGTHQDRSVLTVDGALPQIQSLCGKPGTANEKGVIHEFMAPLGNDVIKGSAACSMSQNPNDVSRCHSQLKDYVRTKMKWSTRHVRPNMQAFIETHIDPLGLDKGSHNTVLLFLGHFEDMICKVWQPATIRAGWIKSGLVVGGENSEGINIKRILAHWIGTKDLDQGDLNQIIGMIPLLSKEVIATTTVSDQSMQQFERFYPRKFINYKKDRAEMATSRGRSCVLLANEDMHRMRLQMNDNAALSSAAVAVTHQEQPPQHHGWKDADRSEQAERICECKAAHTKGARFYRNNAKAWDAHKKSKSHINWETGTTQSREDVIGAVPFEPFADHDYASRPDCIMLTEIARDLSFTKAHAVKFASENVVDKDAPWLSQMMPHNLDRMFGISHALSIQFTAKLRDLGKWGVLQLAEFESARDAFVNFEANLNEPRNE
jgi:hypothetical protein